MEFTFFEYYEWSFVVMGLSVVGGFVDFKLSCEEEGEMLLLE